MATKSKVKANGTMKAEPAKIVYAIRLPRSIVQRIETLAQRVPGAKSPRVLSRDLLLRGLVTLEREVQKIGWKTPAAAPKA